MYMCCSFICKLQLTILHVYKYVSIQGEDDDTDNIPLPGPVQDKRKIDQVLRSVKMYAPTTNHMNWVALKTFKIMCCVNEFSAKSTCTMAYFPACFEKREDVWQEGDKKKRRRGRTKEPVQQTGGLTSGTGGNHKIGDLRELTVQEDKRYLASARKDTTGVEFVAKTCWDCGVWF